MSSVSGKYAIVGVGTSRFGKLQGVSAMGFTLEASKRAIEDAGIDRDALDGVLVMMPAVMGEQHGWAARVAALSRHRADLLGHDGPRRRHRLRVGADRHGGDRRRILHRGAVLLRDPELAAGRASCSCSGRSSRCPTATSARSP